MTAQGDLSRGTRILPRRDLDTDVYTLALERATETLRNFDHVGVMFSGGKDSTAVLNVTLEAARADPQLAARHLPLRVLFIDEEAIPFETEAYVRRTFQREDVAGEWYCLPVKHRNACSRKHPAWWPWAPEARDLWCRPLPPEAITSLHGFPLDPPSARLTTVQLNPVHFPPSLGNCAILMGIRAEESMNRLRAVSRKQVDNYLVRGQHNGTGRPHIWRSYPIYDWSTADVWTAPAVKGWDYNEAYDLMEMAGVPAAMQRCSPAFGEEPLQKIHVYARCFPDVWSKMVSRVPGVGAAWRYALTELYSYSSRPAKPPGMTWPQFTAQYLTKFSPAETAAIAHRLRTEIHRHYRMTGHPLAESAPHPETGRSWDFLLMLAMRGDLKNRKRGGDSLANDDQGRPLPKLWHRYAADLARVAREGRTAELGYPGTFPDDPASLIPEYARK